MTTGNVLQHLEEYHQILCVFLIGDLHIFSRCEGKIHPKISTFYYQSLVECVSTIKFLIDQGMQIRSSICFKRVDFFPPK